MNIKKIQILGPYNTGTNLLSQILWDNLRQNVNIHPECHTLFWKHTNDKQFIINSIKSNKDTLFICLYKPLINWVCSMKKYSYDVKWNKELKNKCNFKGVEYDSIINLYNRFYKMYKGLIDNNDRVISMNYYDIINKKLVVNYISNKLSKFKLNIKINNNIVLLLNKPSKDHGNGVRSSEDAIKKKEECVYEMNKEENKFIINKYYNQVIKNFYEK